MKKLKTFKEDGLYDQAKNYYVPFLETVMKKVDEVIEALREEHEERTKLQAKFKSQGVGISTGTISVRFETECRPIYVDIGLGHKPASNV